MNEHFWLEQALQAIENGASPDEALAQVPPEHREAVRQALEGALWMRAVAAPQLQAAAQAWTPGPAPRPAAETPARPKRIAWPVARWAWALGVLLLVLLGTWGTAHAAQQARPGQWAYPFKRAVEEVQWLWTRAPEDRVRLALDLAAARLAEAQAAWQAHDPDAAAAALDLYAEHLEAARRLWPSVPADRRPSLGAEVAQRLQAQAAVLEHLPRDAATEAAWRLAHQAQRHLRHAVAAGGAPPAQPRPSRTPTPATASAPASEGSDASATMQASATPSPTAAATAQPGAAADDRGPGCATRGATHGAHACPSETPGRNGDRPAPGGSPAPPGGPPPDNGPSSSGQGRP